MISGICTGCGSHPLKSYLVDSAEWCLIDDPAAN
jgi:hypothetical protein